MVEQITSKKCSKCKQIKPISEFGKNSGRKDGFRAHCKICRRREEAEYRKTPRGRVSISRACRKYRESEKGKVNQNRYNKREESKAARKRYRQTEKGRKTDKKYRQSVKGRITNLKSRKRCRQRLGKITNPTLFGEGPRKMKKSTPDYDKINEGRRTKLTSRQWRNVIECVRDEAKDCLPGFYRKQKTDELIVEILMLDVSPRQLINLNIEDMPCYHGEPHIIIRNPKNGQTWELFIDRALETKINTYVQDFRPDTNEKDAFLATLNGKRFFVPYLHDKLMGRRRKDKSNDSLGIAGKSGVEYLSPGIFRRTLRQQQKDKNSKKQKKTDRVLPLTKFIKIHVNVPKDANGKPDKDEVAEVRALITNAHKRRILNPPLPEPIGGRGRAKHTYNYKVGQMRRRYSKWRKIRGLGKLPPLVSIKIVYKNQS